MFLTFWTHHRIKPKTTGCKIHRFGFCCPWSRRPPFFQKFAFCICAPNIGKWCIKFLEIKIDFSLKSLMTFVLFSVHLEANEFLRRFCLHILPPKFVKIRHYGFLASRVKKKLKMHQFKLGIIPQLKLN